MVTFLQKENDLKKISSQMTTLPIDEIEKVVYDKKEMKSQKVILDAVKYHLIPHFSKK